MILGIAIISRAPRDEIATQFAAHAPAGTKVILRGCLDGMTDEEIAGHPPESGADTLYSRLSGNRDIKISKKFVVARSPGLLARLRADGCDAIVYACTGDFPPMQGDAGVVFPSRVLNGLSAALLPKGKLGLLVPLPEQAEKLTSKWRRPGLEIVTEALAPSADTAEVAGAAERLKARNPQLVAMDCMSYTPDTKAVVKGIVGVPTILGVTATARVMNEMLV